MPRIRAPTTPLSDKSALRADLRWVDIDADVYLDGAKTAGRSEPAGRLLSYVLTF